jgi:hypothetical protein
MPLSCGGLDPNVRQTISSALPSAKGNTLVAHIAALAEAAKSCPEAFEDKSNVITTYLVQELLMSNTPSTEVRSLMPNFNLADRSYFNNSTG